MKTPLTILFFFVLLTGYRFHPNISVAHYVSTSGTGSGNGLSSGAAWTLAQLNASSTVLPSDNVYFKKGDVFASSITTADGTVGNPINYSTYGTGANPIISAFTTVTTWTQVGATRVWYASLNMGSVVLRMVLVDGEKKGMGRTPNVGAGYLNSGYNQYQHHTGNTSITDDNLTGTAYVGAEVVIRKSNRWILDRQPITAHSGGLITYSSSCCPFGNNTVAEPADSNGYFIQNSSLTLDVDGEWFDSTAVNRLYMYSASDPNLRTIKASTVETLNTAHSYNTFTNIDFEGGLTAILAQSGQTNVSATTCNFRWQAGWSFFGQNNTTITFTSCTIENNFNTGFAEADGGSAITVTGCTFHNIGDIAGTSESGDGGRRPISIEGSNNTTVTYNTVINSGLHGIYVTGTAVAGNNITVRYNRVDSVGMITDDCGGVYIYCGIATTYSGIVISDNIISNCIGAFPGAWSQYNVNWGLCHGIYLDGYSNHVTLNNNTISGGDANGIMENGNANNTITNNLCYNNRWGIAYMQYDAGRIFGVTVTGNQFIAKQTTQRAAYLLRAGTAESPAVWGTVNNNYYCRPLSDNTDMNIDARANYPVIVEDISLATWKSRYAIDASSNISAITASSLSDFKFDYNYTGSAVVIPLSAIYKDVTGATYSVSYSLPAYSGKVLILFSAVPSQPNRATMKKKVIFR